MKRLIVVTLLALIVSAQNSPKLSTFFVEIPFVMQGRFHTHYLRVSAPSRVEAIGAIGITVFTEEEWLKICKSPYCEIPPAVDCGNGAKK